MPLQYNQQRTYSPAVNRYWIVSFASLVALSVSTPGSAQTGADLAPPEEVKEEAPPVLVPPKLVDFVQAEYPADAAKAGIEGAVEFKILIAPDGTVQEAEIVGTPEHGFGEAALAAVKQFKFQPATKNGEPIPARVGYRYVFELAEPEPEPEPEPELPKPGRYIGKIIDVDGEKPLLGAELIFTSSDQSFARRVLSNDKGQFSIDDIPPGKYNVRVSLDGYGEQTLEEEIRSNEATDVLYRLREITESDEGENVFGATAVIDPPPREVTRRTIRAAELTRIPGTRGDALRAVELLPGVARPPFGAGALIVRGSAPGDSQTFIEGVPVPQLYHFGGLTSVFSSRLLSQIDFYPGNFSSKYGRKIGGVLEVGVRDPRQDGFHGVLELSAIDANIIAEVPIGDKFAVAFGFRRSIIDVIFDKVIPEDLFQVVASPVYYDYQLIATYKPNKRDRFRLLVYGSSDRFQISLDDSLGDDPAVRGSLDLTSRFNFAQLSWDRKINDKWDLDMDIQGGPIKLNFALGDQLGFDANFNQFYFRTEVRGRPNDGLRLIFGTDIFWVPFNLDFKGPQPRQQEGTPGGNPLAGQETLQFSNSGRAYRPGFYAEADAKISDTTQLIMGARVDYHKEVKRFSFDPRLTALFSVTEDLRLKAGLGMYTQPPEFQESAEIIGNQDLDLIKSMHFGGGFEYQIAEGIRVGVDGFYKSIWDRVVNTENGAAPFFENGGIGRIYGAEISGRIEPVSGRRFFGFLSYTLSRSERKDRFGDDWRLFDFDQTHIFTASFVYRFKRNWELGATFRIVSGNPSTPVVGAVHDFEYDVYYPINGVTNSTRNKLFNRLDVRVSKTWIFKSWKLAFFLDIQNAYNRQNQEGLLYNYDYTQQDIVPGLPIIPAIGIRGEI